MKQKTVFACQECGAQSAKWLGRCPECGAWNSMVEERPVPAGVTAASTEKRYALAGAAGPQLYADIDTVVAERLSTGIGEFDRVLGGGVVPGSLVLIGGEPGIGKSTLLLQAAAHFARAVGPVLYCSGEESEHQIKSRGERLGVERAPLYILAETCLERILEEIARLRPAFVIVDSIQTVFSLKFQSAPGSIGQVRESATQLLFAAKGQNIPTFLVGHVTKDGNLAGPKALEHIVDTVLYFEGEKHHAHRVVRAVKNRFGAVSELGVFEMTGTGLKAVPNPSQLFLAERAANAAGSAVLCCVEGSRPLLVEVQALVSTSSYGNARQDGERPRSESAVAAAGRAREARRPQPHRRGRVRQRRRRDDGGRAGGRPRDRRRRRLERAQPADPRRHGCVRRGRSGGRDPRARASASLRVREAAQMGFTRCIVPEGNSGAREPLATAEAPAGARWSGSRPSRRRSIS